MSALGRALAAERAAIRAALREREAATLDAVSAWLRSRPQWAEPPVTAVAQTLAAVDAEAVLRAAQIRTRIEDPSETP